MIKKKRPLFLFAFANDSKQSLQLKEEERVLRKLLAAAHDQGQIEYLSLGAATIDDVYQTFNRFHNRIALFHYSGHAGVRFLELEDVRARSANLATLIGMQENLKLVVLNGCSTSPQVETLFSKGVKAIIATSSPVGDRKALQFSKVFYGAFAYGKNIEQAFDTAISSLQNETPDLETTRGIGLQSVKDSSWGRYAMKDEYLRWILPEPVKEPEGQNFFEEVELSARGVNSDLVHMTFEGMSEREASYKALWQVYQSSKSPQLFNTLQNMMLDSLPSSLSIQLRDLFTPEGKTKGRLRLIEINESYLTLIKLLAAISLANLWKVRLDEKKLEPKSDFLIREKYRNELKRYYALNPETAESFDYIWLIATISRIFQDNQIKPFIGESENLHLSLINFDESYKAYRALEQDLRSRIKTNNIDVSEVEELCFESERNLGVLLRRCGFLCTYQLVTVKQIEVYKPNRVKNPEYVHYKAVLKGRDYATIDDAPINREGFTSNNSVLVTKDINTASEQLNLSPFVIDENAFKIKEEKLPKIHFFKGWLDGKSLYYEHAEMLADNFRIKQNFDAKKYKKNLQDLQKQFLWFKQDLGL